MTYPTASRACGRPRMFLLGSIFATPFYLCFFGSARSNSISVSLYRQAKNLIFFRFFASFCKFLQVFASFCKLLQARIASKRKRTERYGCVKNERTQGNTEYVRYASVFRHARMDATSRCRGRGLGSGRVAPCRREVSKGDEREALSFGPRGQGRRTASPARLHPEGLLLLRVDFAPPLQQMQDRGSTLLHLQR